MTAGYSKNSRKWLKALQRLNSLLLNTELDYMRPAFSVGFFRIPGWNLALLPAVSHWFTAK